MSDTSRFPPVTVLGAGPMGRALAGAFLDAGHPVTVWNRTRGRLDELVARGAREAATVAGAVRPGSLVVVCVLDYDALHAILEPAAPALAGSTVLSLTADTPARARQAAGRFAELGVPYLDGSVLSPAPSIGTDDAVLLYSGPAELYDRHRDTLGALGGTGTWLGTDPGRAAAYDVALLDLFWTAVSGWVHALALARAQGVAARGLVPHARGILRIVDDVVGGFADDLDDGRFDRDTASLRSALAGMEHVADTAEQSGVDSGVLRAAAAVARRAVIDGFGDDGVSRLAERLAPTASTPDTTTPR